jgi:polyhydroxyalkanoate synthesis regulator phasin
MVIDGLRGYVQLANGLTDVTRERARSAAKALVAQGEAGLGTVLPESVKAQVAALTDDLLATSRANRALLVNLVRAEVDRTLARLGPTLSAELTAARERAQRLEERVADLEHELRQARAGGSSRAPAKKTARKTTARKTTARKTTAKKTTASETTAKKPT